MKDTESTVIPLHTDKIPDAKSGSSGKFVESIFRQYNNALRKYLMQRLGCQEDVDEIAQEVFLRLLRYNKIEKLKNPKAFVFQIAVNLLKDRASSKYMRLLNRHVSISDVDLVSTSPSPESLLESKEAVTRIYRVLENVKPEARRVFILHRFKGLTYNKIASEVGISKRRVKYHLHCVMIQFREAFEEPEDK